MTPNCDKVLKATIFLISISAQAQKPAITIVTEPNTINHSVLKLLKRISKQIPAVTNVEECTKALTGVGAAIAAGNQEEKGNWALLVIAVKISKRVTEYEQLPGNNLRDKRTNKKPSPKRLVKAVIMPLLRDFRFLKQITKRKEVTPKPSQPIKAPNKLAKKINKIIDLTKLITSLKNRR